jgi:sRNA-binding regulator protein Hfq
MSSQDKFLSENIGKRIHVYTVDGYHLRAILLLFDTWTLLLQHPFDIKKKQLVYKSGIVAIQNEVDGDD